MSTASEILGRIEDDPVFRGFLETGFDPAAFASKIVKADVGKSAQQASSHTPVLQQAGGGNGALFSSVSGTIGVERVGAPLASAESVSSQAEITLDSMSSHIARIESAIRVHILDNEEDFLGSVGGVTELSRRTEEFRNGVRELRRSFMRVRREVSEPHEVIRLRTQQLKNLHSATRLLKRALRVLAALRRLRAQEDALGLDSHGMPKAGVVGGGAGVSGDLRELAKAAQSLQEFEGLLRDPDVAELEVVARERPYVEAYGAAVRRMSADSLGRGLKALNQTDVGGALQVFFNLGCLPARVKACVTHLADEADAAASAAFQPAALEDATSSVGPPPLTTPNDRSSSPTPGSTAGTAGVGGRAPTAREAGAAAARRRASRMRAHAGKLASSLYSTSMEAWGLQRVLDKKRDPTTRALLDGAVRADRTAGLSSGAYSAYWDGLCSAVRGAVERALVVDGVSINGSGGGFGVENTACQALVAMYPYLRKAFLHLIRRLEEGTPGGKQGSRWPGDGIGVGVGIAISSAGGGQASLAAVGAVPSWSRAMSSANGGVRSGGVLGASRWLSVALDNEGDTFSEDNQGETMGAGSARTGEGEAGAEAGAGPNRGINSRRSIGPRRRGVGGQGPAVDGRDGGEDAVVETASGSDGARLLEALGPLRDLFLARSLERLTTPVEQMFPQYDGYMAAVPSKHDLASFVRSIHAELALAVPPGSITTAGGGGRLQGGDAEAGSEGAEAAEADLSLAPLLLKGVSCAVKLLCAKVERMHSVEEAAYTFGGGATRSGGGGGDDGSGGMGGGSAGMGGGGMASSAALAEAWAPTAEQDHNLQLLELVAKLREALLGIPALVLPSAGAAAAAGGDGSQQAEMAGFVRACREQVDEAIAALDATASDVILEPYLSGVARALEDVVAKMHRENFGPGAADASDMGNMMMPGDPRGSGSTFLVELQGALAALQADHFGRISAVRAPFVQTSLRMLAARVLRTYVTHCALLRPLSEAGKARVAQDMATLEIALSPLARVSELGAVYQESRAFRTLLFVDDEDGSARDSRFFLTEACMAHLRPSSVWHYLFSRAPDELSSPHVWRGMSEQAYVAWLLGGGAAAEAKAKEDAAGAEAGGGVGGGGGGGAVTSGQGRSKLSPDTSYMAEVGAWGVIQDCLDAYHQRRSAIGGAVGAGWQSELPRAVTLLPEAGPALLSGYETRVGNDKQAVKGGGASARS